MTTPVDRHAELNQLERDLADLRQALEAHRAAQPDGFRGRQVLYVRFHEPAGRLEALAVSAVQAARARLRTR
jgi:hypothetical protein